MAAMAAMVGVATATAVTAGTSEAGTSNSDRGRPREGSLAGGV
jgi:hypothetical protein